MTDNVKSPPRGIRGPRIRPTLIWLHRWAGLAMALFLIVEGLTGSLLAFNGDLSRWLDPEPASRSHPAGAKPLEFWQLAERAEALMPRAVVWYFPVVADDRVVVRMAARRDPATGKPYPEDPGSITLDPFTGSELGRYPYGGHRPGFLPSVMPFVYELHTSLAIGNVGTWILVVLALAWTLDCFVGFYLTLPPRFGSFWRRWKVAWHVKWPASFVRVNFDLHRAGSLWLWPLLFVFAWSSVHLTDGQLGVYEWVMVKVFHQRSIDEIGDLYFPLRKDHGPKGLGWRDAQSIGERLAAQQAAARGFHAGKGRSLNFFEGSRSYNYTADTDLPFPGDQTLTVFFDVDDGSLRGVMSATGDRWADSFSNWLDGLHMARDPMNYTAYRIALIFIGLFVGIISATGVYIWWRKRVARRLIAGKARMRHMMPAVQARTAHPPDPLSGAPH